MGTPEETAGDRAAFILCEAIALMLILPPGEPLYRGEPITLRMVLFLSLGGVACIAGAFWPHLRRRLTPRLSASVVRAASDFRWWLAIIFIAFLWPALPLFSQTPPPRWLWGVGVAGPILLWVWAYRGLQRQGDGVTPAIPDVPILDRSAEQDLAPVRLGMAGRKMREIKAARDFATSKLEIALDSPEYTRASTGHLRSGGYVRLRNLTESTTIRGVRVVLETIEPVQRRFNVCEPFDLHAGDKAKVPFVSFPGEDGLHFRIADGSALPAVDGNMPIGSGADLLIRYTATLFAVGQDTAPASVQCGFNLIKRDNDLALGLTILASANARLVR